jgi:hypothetical protein
MLAEDKRAFCYDSTLGLFNIYAIKKLQSTTPNQHKVASKITTFRNRF